MAIPLLALLSLGLTIALQAINNRLEQANQRSPLGGLNREITDLAFQNRNVTNQDSLFSLDDIVVIDIDDASVQKLGRTQLWPRSFTARVIEHVSAGNPAAIGLDILYTEPDTLSSHYARLLNEAGFNRTDQILAAMNTDDRLAGALRTSGNTYLALYDDTGRPPRDELTAAYEALRITRDSSEIARRIHSLTHPVLPIPPLRSAAEGIAPIPLPDGVIRRYPVARRLPADSASGQQNALVPSFSLLLAVDQLDTPVSSMQFGEDVLRLGSKRTIPLDRNGRFRLNWLGEEESIRRISYHKVLRQSVPSTYFKDKVVFLGGSAKGLEDLKSTPVQGQKPGVLVHAEAFLNVMNQAHLTERVLWELWPWLFGGALPFLALILSVQPLYASLLTLLLGAIEFFGYVLYLFPRHGIVLPVGTILTFTLITLICGVVYKYVTEEWAKQKLRDAFASYVSASIVDQVTQNPETLELGGEKKRLTVLFCDIRHFTTYSEHLDPQEVVTFLNRFFDRMTAAVFEYDGTVDKFIGDGMMAIFGAPLDLEDHPTRACAAALAMSEGLDTLNQEENLEASGPASANAPIGVGVGINTGEMVAGNIGSSQRFEYTVVGDAVNLAARLEPLNRILGTRILVSEMTYQNVDQAPWTFRELGSVLVKGRENPVVLYELLDPNTYPEPDALCTQFEEALSLYHDRQFATAKAAFEECRSLHPEDGPSSYYLNRCTACEKNPSRYEPALDLRNLE